MNKRYVQSFHAHKKYRPKQSGWKKISKLLKSRRRRITAKAEPLAWSASHNAVGAHGATSRGWWFSLVLCVSWAAMLLYTPYFKITKIHYSGLGALSVHDVNESLHAYWSQAYAFFPTNNYFLLNEKRLTTYLKDTFYLSGISIKKIFPNSLEVSIKEKTQSIVLDTGTSLFLLDESGNSLKQLQNIDSVSLNVSASTTPKDTPNQLTAPLNAAATTSTQPQDSLQPSPNANAYAQALEHYGDYPIVYDPNNSGISEHQEHVLKPATVKAVLALARDLSKQGRGALPKYFTVDDATDRILAVTNKPWVAYFKADDDITNQLNNLELILRDNKPEHYIDLRYGTRVYWK